MSDIVTLNGKTYKRTIDGEKTTYESIDIEHIWRILKNKFPAALSDSDLLT